MARCSWRSAGCSLGRPKQHSTKTVRLGFSPYTYARVAVMRSFLLKKEDYDRILKMGVHELLRFLQETHYKQEFDDYHVLSEGTASIEAAFHANLGRSFQKLYTISDAAMKQVLGAYLLRYDMENIKMILRSKAAGLPSASVEPLLYSSVNYGSEFLQMLLSRKSVEEVASSLSFFKKGYGGIKSSDTDLFSMENALDHYYVQTVEDFAKNLRGQGVFMSSLMKQEINFLNIRTILRLLASQGKITPSDIGKYLITPSSFIKKLAEKSGVVDVVKELHRHKMTSLTGDEPDLLTKLEIDLTVAILRRAALLSHQHVLSANSILSYLFAKETEVNNLKTILKGKKLEIRPEYLEPLLVIAK